MVTKPKNPVKKSPVKKSPARKSPARKSPAKKPVDNKPPVVHNNSRAHAAQVAAKAFVNSNKTLHSIVNNMYATAGEVKLLIKDKASQEKAKKILLKMTIGLIRMIDRMSDRMVTNGYTVRVSTSLDRNNSRVNNIRHLSAYTRTPSLPEAWKNMAKERQMLVKIGTTCKQY